LADVIVADASVLIAYLSPGDEHHSRAVDALVDHDQFVVHPLTIAEVLVHPTRTGSEHSVLATLLSIGLRPAVTQIDPVPLARLRATTGLKMPDCIVLMTAQQHACGILTFDDRLAAAATTTSPS
jgi:predicted nucleic acid-binding protein